MEAKNALRKLEDSMKIRLELIFLNSPTISLQALDADVPLIFISFPSVKDPEWNNHPGEHLTLLNFITCLALLIC